MRWQGIALGIPLSACGITLLELARVPLASHRSNPLRALAALGQLARDAVTQLAIPALVLLAAAVVLAWTERRAGVRRRLGLAALAGLGVLESAALREVLIAHPPFAWSAIATAAFVALAVVLAASFVWLGSQEFERRRRVALAVGALAVVAAVALARGHYAFWVGLYPTMHACALATAFVVLAVGLALMIAASPSPAFARRAALALVAPLAVLAVLDLPAAAEARPAVLAYTELGRAAGVARALEEEADALLPRELPPPRVDPLLRPDAHAAARFAEHSGLPALPEAFSLESYDVLFVLSDATRFDRTSLAREDGPTPHLVALASRGAFVFERAYAPSNGTFPSLASVLAMTPVSFAELDVRARFWRGRLRDERTTAPEAMRAAGRATFWIGHDHARCFSDHVLGLEQGFESRTLVPDAPDTDAHVASAAIEAIRAHRAAGRRYFGLVFFGSPHDPYLARDPQRPGGTDLERYDHELAYMDAQLGRLIEALETESALDETIVIFAGDHGEAFGEHGHRFHLSSMHEEQIHVPLVVRIGGVSGGRIARPTSTAYVLPWLLARGAPAERAVVEQVLREDLGPMLRALDGAVLSEMIGPRSQEAALVWNDHTVIYDVLADVVRIYGASDRAQVHDLREDEPALLGHFAPIAQRYRRARFTGRRFRFLELSP